MSTEEEAEDSSLDGSLSEAGSTLEAQHGLQGLPEIDDAPPLFESSGARIVLPSEMSRHPMVIWLAIMLFVTGMLGLVNGMDYIDGDSGLINHRNFIYRDAERAAPGTAVLLGQVVYEDGSPAPNHTVKVTVRDANGSIIEKQNTTDDNGNFRVDGLNPGLQVLLMANESKGTAQLVEHEILLSAKPPFSFEPLAFTTLKLTFPSDEAFDTEGDGTMISYVASQAENSTQLYDESAAGMYVMVGVGFSGLALLGLGTTFLGLRSGNRTMLRSASVLIFFTQGPYMSACCLGFLAYGLTFALPKRRID